MKTQGRSFFPVLRRALPPLSRAGICLIICVGPVGLSSGCTPPSTNADLEFRPDTVNGTAIASGDLIGFAC